MRTEIRNQNIDIRNTFEMPNSNVSNGALLSEGLRPHLSLVISTLGQRAPLLKL